MVIGGAVAGNLKSAEATAMCPVSLYIPRDMSKPGLSENGLVHLEANRELFLVHLRGEICLGGTTRRRGSFLRVHKIHHLKHGLGETGKL